MENEKGEEKKKVVTLPLQHHWKPNYIYFLKTLLTTSTSCNKWQFINWQHHDTTNFLYLDRVSKRNCKMKGFQEDNSQLVRTFKQVSKKAPPLMIPKGFKVKINLKPYPILTSFLIHAQHWFEFNSFDFETLWLQL